MVMPRLPDARPSLAEARNDLSGWVLRYANSGIAITVATLEGLRLYVALRLFKEPARCMTF